MQYAVVPPAPELGKTTSLTDADRAMVVDILRQNASRLHLTDRTASSMIPETLAYYQATDADNPMKLVAWRQGDRILIDFMAASEELGEPLGYRNAREHLMADLQAAFGNRVQVVPLQGRKSP